MPQSLTAIYLHIVFSTKGRAPMITHEFRDDLHAYLGGIALNSGCQPLGIGGVADHVHVLVRLGKSVSVADLVRLLKANSSKWVHERQPKFAWQPGYAAFSLAADALVAAQNYVANQAAHHTAVSFQDELRQMLRDSGTAWDETYLWD